MAVGTTESVHCIPFLHLLSWLLPGSPLPTFLPSGQHQDPRVEEGPPALIQFHSLHPQGVQAFPLRLLSPLQPVFRPFHPG